MNCVRRVVRAGAMTLAVSWGVGLAGAATIAVSGHGTGLGASLAGAEDPPPVFSSLGFTPAREQAVKEKKILLVKATAEWCGPCKQMDKTTWRSERIEKWVKANALAIAVDIDDQPQWAKDFGTDAIPCTIAFVDGREFDRVVGYRTAEQLGEWLEGVARGERAVDRLRKAAGDRAGPDGQVDVQARFDLARELAGSVKPADLDLASEEFAWLWDHMLDHRASMAAVRTTFMANDMQRLAAKHPGAKARFVTLRDREDAKLKAGERTWERLTDWIALNEIVGDEDRTLAWVDRIKGDEEGLATLRRAANRVERLLIARERWADLAKLWVDPMAKIEAMRRMEAMIGPPPLPPGADEDQRNLMKELFAERRRDEYALVYAVALAGGQNEQATKVAGALLKEDDTPAMRGALVSAALRAGQAREEQIPWAEAAAPLPKHADLPDRLGAALKRGR